MSSTSTVQYSTHTTLRVLPLHCVCICPFLLCPNLESFLQDLIDQWEEDYQRIQKYLSSYSCILAEWYDATTVAFLCNRSFCKLGVFWPSSIWYHFELLPYLPWYRSQIYLCSLSFHMWNFSWYDFYTLGFEDVSGSILRCLNCRKEMRLCLNLSWKALFHATNVA